MLPVTSGDYLHHATSTTWVTQVFAGIPGISKGALGGSEDHDVVRLNFISHRNTPVNSYACMQVQF